MNSFWAAALRLIFPLGARGATVDFFGTEALVFDFDNFDDLVEVPLEDDERLDEEREDEACPFCAGNFSGRKRTTANNATTARLSMNTFL